MSQIVAIIGASEKKHRVAHRAMVMLRQHGYQIRLVNPYKENIEGIKCFSSVSDINEHIHTVTLYVNPVRFRDHIDEVIRAKPERVIMNPGSEDTEMATKLENAGIHVDRACTLVMLTTGNF
jgi:predicted CoA-binding protein